MFELNELQRRFIRGVIGQVQEQADIVHGAVLLEVGLEEPGRLHVHLVGQTESVTLVTSVSVLCLH